MTNFVQNSMLPTREPKIFPKREKSFDTPNPSTTHFRIHLQPAFRCLIQSTTCKRDYRYEKGFFGSIVIMVVLTAANTEFAQSKDKTEKSFYERLGGYDALAAATDDFAARLITDKKLGKYFVGMSDDSITGLRQHVIDFLCMATGGPCKDPGREMTTVHKGLEITKKEWDISVARFLTRVKDLPNKFRHQTHSLFGLSK